MNATKSFAILAVLVMLLTGAQTTYAHVSAQDARPSLESVTVTPSGSDLLGLPDLIITQAGTAASINNPYFKFTVKNIGPNGNTGVSTLAVYRNGYPPLFLSVPPLQAGQSYTSTVYIGCHRTFSLVADYGNQYQEWSETNNTYGPASLCLLPSD